MAVVEGGGGGLHEDVDETNSEVSAEGLKTVDMNGSLPGLSGIGSVKQMFAKFIINGCFLFVQHGCIRSLIN